MPIYNDLNTMLRDIEGYARTTGYRVIPMDDPRQRLIGFGSAEGPTIVRWQIALSLFRDQLDSLRLTIRAYFDTVPALV